MTIQHDVTGNILESDRQTLVCPVNTIGVMGKGLALDMSKAYRGLLYNYRKVCMNGQLTVQSLWVYPVNKHRQILCFPTKEHWRQPSKIEWIDFNLAQLALDYQELGITSLAIPRLGCGLGGLDWEPDVRPLVYRHLKNLPIPITVYGP